MSNFHYQKGNSHQILIKVTPEEVSTIKTIFDRALTYQIKRYYWMSKSVIFVKFADISFYAADTILKDIGNIVIARLKNLKKKHNPIKRRAKLNNYRL